MPAARELAPAGILRGGLTATALCVRSGRGVGIAPARQRHEPADGACGTRPGVAGLTGYDRVVAWVRTSVR